MWGGVVGLNRAAGAKFLGVLEPFTRVKSPFFSPAAREKNEDFRAIYKGKMK